MKWQTWLWVACAVMIAVPGLSSAQEGPRPYTFVNRLRLEYDDNVRQTENDPDSSLKVIEEIEFLVNLNLDQTFISVRYRPSFVWWDDRAEDETDIHHDFDFVLNHAFTPRLSLVVQDTLRRAELPELIDDRVIVREDNDYIYNTLDGSLGIAVRPDLRVSTSARYMLLRYDDSTVAGREDYDLYVLGVSVGHQLKPSMVIGGDLRYESADYDTEVDRGSSSVQAGGSLEYVFSPNLMGSTRLGFQEKSFDDSDISSESAPYGEASLTYLPSPATRLTAGLGYSLYEADVYPFASQERTKLFANIAHDLTAKVSWYLSGLITQGDYNGEDLPRNATVGDLPPKVQEQLAQDVGVPAETLALAPLSDEYIDMVSDKSEDTVQISTRVTYKVNHSNWIEAGLQYTKLDSDLRENYDRNRIHVGWKTQF